MARYMLSVHSVEGEAGPPMTQDEMQLMMKRIYALEEEMNAVDALVYSAKLTDADTATVVRTADGEVLMTDGPFAEAKEHLGGFYLIEAPDLDAALGWAAKVTTAINRPIEVRALWEPPQS